MAGTGLLLGIDAGTSATKLVLLDPDGGIVAEVSEPAGYSSPRVGWAEADADGWWRNVCAGVPRVLAVAGRAATDVAAVGVSGMVPALVLVDADGRVLRPSIQQNDARAVDEIEYFQKHTDAADVLARTGSAVTQQSVGPKLRWLRRHEPDVLARAARVCGSYDLVAVKEEVGGEVPVLLNTGARAETIADFLAVADGVIVGSSLKVDGYTWNPVDPPRVKAFMDAVRAVRAE